MRANFFPIYNNSLLVFNEAKNNLKESDLMKFIANSEHELIPAVPKTLPEIVL